METRIPRRAFVRQTATWTGAAATLGLLGRSIPIFGQDPSPKEPAQSNPQPSTRVRIWCEGTAPKAVYPDDIDGTLAGFLGTQPGLSVTTARLDEPDAGLADADLDATDVLVWWGRLRHDDLPDDRAFAVVERVQAGHLGLVALHASSASKPFRELMGGVCEPQGWSDEARAEHVAVQAPEHPIAYGVTPFTIPKADMFAEPFAVPEPEAVVFVSSWEGAGGTFRSGLTWTIGDGRVVYFRPGHDAYPVLFHPSVRRIIANAARWAAHHA